MKNKWMILLILFALGAVLINNGSQQASASSEYDLIRFHVLANSDRDEDQQLKLMVRDEIMKTMTEKMADVKTLEESREIILEELDTIKAAAEAEIERNHKNYPVSVQLERKLFPTRKYGNYILPAGEYEALSVVIGDGGGQNWWCVMFPPLCFVDIKNGLIDEKTKLELETILAEDDQELKIEVRSKLYDLYQQSKEQINRMASFF